MKNMTKNMTKMELFVLVSLIGGGAWMRVMLTDFPNVAPVAACTLWATVYFRRATWALAVPLLTMAISDVFIGSYHGGQMAVVYVMLALPVACRKFLQRNCSLNGRTEVVAPLMKFVGCAAVASILFFVVTNFAHWCFYDMYPRTMPGLVQCYVGALPFFRYTLTGDFVFAASLFSSYAAAHHLSRVADPSRA